eukprot:169318-Chlamydomonas_euryale.AAC.7
MDWQPLRDVQHAAAHRAGGTAAARRVARRRRAARRKVARRHALLALGATSFPPALPRSSASSTPFLSTTPATPPILGPCVHAGLII